MVPLHIWQQSNLTISQRRYIYDLSTIHIYRASMYYGQYTLHILHGVFVYLPLGLSVMLVVQKENKQNR